MGTKVTKTRKFTPHSEHYHAARMFLRRAQETPSGSGFQLQASLVFCAFALEAYFNFVGQKCLGHWEEVERAPTLAKLRLLMAEFDVHFGRRTRPLQTVHKLFQYRNWLAHTRPEIVAEETSHSTEVDDSFLFASPKHKWEKFVHADVVERALEDVKSVIEALNDACPMRERMPLAGITSHTFTTDPNT